MGNELVLVRGKSALKAVKSLRREVVREAGRGAVVRVTDDYLARFVGLHELGADDFRDLVYLHARHGAVLGRIGTMLNRGLAVADIELVYLVYKAIEDELRLGANNSGRKRPDRPPILPKVEAWVRAFKLEGEPADDVASGMMEAAIAVRNLHQTGERVAKSDWAQRAVQQILNFQRREGGESPEEVVERMTEFEEASHNE